MQRILRLLDTELELLGENTKQGGKIYHVHFNNSVIPNE